MSAFNDATCPKCNRKVSWFGNITDRPKCSCGYRPSQEELAQEEAEMDAMTEKILKRKREEKS